MNAVLNEAVGLGEEWDHLIVTVKGREIPNQSLRWIHRGNAAQQFPALCKYSSHFATDFEMFALFGRTRRNREKI